MAVVDAGPRRGLAARPPRRRHRPTCGPLEVFAQLSADPETDELDLGADPDADDQQRRPGTWSTPPAEPHELRRLDAAADDTGLPPIRPSVEWDLDGSGDWRGLA